MESTYKLPFRRRGEKRTDFKKRLALVKSGKPRLVVRRGNNSFTSHISEFNVEGDVTKASAHSSELEKFGYTGHGGNTTAGYLTGYLLGKRALDEGAKETVFDIGLQNSVKGSSVYGFLKGVIDSGLQVPHDESVFPDEDRIKGEHLKEKPSFDDVVSKIDQDYNK